MIDKFFDYYLDLIKKDKVKNDIRNIISPIIKIIFLEISPFIYLILCLICLTFLINLAILIIFIFIFKKKNIPTL